MDSLKKAPQGSLALQLRQGAEQLQRSFQENVARVRDVLGLGRDSGSFEQQVFATAEVDAVRAADLLVNRPGLVLAPEVREACRALLIALPQDRQVHHFLGQALDSTGLMDHAFKRLTPEQQVWTVNMFRLPGDPLRPVEPPPFLPLSPQRALEALLQPVRPRPSGPAGAAPPPRDLPKSEFGGLMFRDATFREQGGVTSSELVEALGVLTSFLRQELPRPLRLEEWLLLKQRLVLLQMDLPRLAGNLGKDAFVVDVGLLDRCDSRLKEGFPRDEVSQMRESFARRGLSESVRVLDAVLDSTSPVPPVPQASSRPYGADELVSQGRLLVERWAPGLPRTIETLRALEKERAMGPKPPPADLDRRWSEAHRQAVDEMQAFRTRLLDSSELTGEDARRLGGLIDIDSSGLRVARNEDQSRSENVPPEGGGPLDEYAPREDLWNPKLEVGRFNRVVGEALPDFLRLTNGRGLPAKVFGMTGRSYFDDDRRVALDARSSGTEVLLHELGHSLENSDLRLRAAMTEFRRQNATADQPVKLNELLAEELSHFPPWYRYDDDEVAYPGNYISKYAAKTYPDGATEILSIGLQYFATADRMVRLMVGPATLEAGAENHFYLTLGALRPPEPAGTP